MKYQLKINKDYAAKYNQWRQKEEYNKLKDKYGEEAESSSSGESEDENAEALTKQVEENWFKTLAALKRKDPQIYQPDVEFYEKNSDEGQSQVKKNKKISKPRTAQDIARQIITKKSRSLKEEDTYDIEGDNSEDNEDESDGEEIIKKEEILSSQVPGYYEEQEQIKQSFQAALKDDSDSDSETLLSQRKLSKEQKEAEETDYINWLKDQKSSHVHNSSIHKNLVSLKDFWSKPDLGDDEKFLRDYILNKKYLDTADNEGSIDDFDDEDEVEQQELFEKKYNFRFEEPDKDFIKKHPRIIDDSLRKDEKKRSTKRKAAAERKETAKKTRLEEIKRLKNLKKMEIADKIEKLKEVTGNKRLAFDVDELQSDFDPTKYDQVMQETFKSYDDEDGDLKKPVFGYDAEIDDDAEDWDNWEVGGAHGDLEGDSNSEPSQYADPYTETYDYTTSHADDLDFNMDADYDPSIPSVSKKSKRKMKKTKFLQSLIKKKPTYNPEDTTFDSYYKEYYDLDCEDVIDDMPCRFGYKQVPANDFGLDITEILNCPDKELNKWNSFKFMNQLKTDDEEKYLVHKFRKRQKNETMKRQMLPSLFIKESKKRHKSKDSVSMNDNAYIQTEKSGMSRKSVSKDKIMSINEEGRMKRTKNSYAADTNNHNDISPKEKNNGEENELVFDAAVSNNEKKTKKQKLKKVDKVTTPCQDVVKLNVNLSAEERKNESVPDTHKNNVNKNVENNKIKKKKIKCLSEPKERSLVNDQCLNTTGGNVSISQDVMAKLSRTQRRRLSKKAAKQKKTKSDIVISDARLKAYGVTNVKQFRYTHKVKQH